MLSILYIRVPCIHHGSLKPETLAPKTLNPETLNHKSLNLNPKPPKGLIIEYCILKGTLIEYS